MSNTNSTVVFVFNNLYIKLFGVCLACVCLCVCVLFVFKQFICFLLLFILLFEKLLVAVNLIYA